MCLPMQGTQFWSLVQEDSTCRGTTKPQHHNYWVCTLEPMSHSYWNPCTLETVFCNKRSHCNEKPAPCNQESSRSPQLEEAHLKATKTQCSQKKCNSFKEINEMFVKANKPMMFKKNSVEEWRNVVGKKNRFWSERQLGSHPHSAA